MKFADLHLHTIFSDGTYTPDALARSAKEHGLDAIALTDHDTVDGIAEMQEAGKKHGVEVIPGVEITTRLEREEVHILGYFFKDNWRDPILVSILEYAKKQREKRVDEFAIRFQELGIPLTANEIRECSSCGTIGRVHVAQALKKRKVVKSIEEAFERFLRYGKPGFVERPRMETAEAIRLIRRVGGVTSLAHPGLSNVEHRIHEMRDQGLHGLEVWHSRHSPAQTSRYQALAKQLGLVPTGGSDCHGTIRDEILLGTVKLPYENVVALRETSS